MNGLIALIKPIIVIASVITLNLNNLLAAAKLFFFFFLIAVQALFYRPSIPPLILHSVYSLTPPTTNQRQILYPALVMSLITVPKSLMIKITQQSNGEQALSSLSFLQLLIITPLRCYSILLKCRQLTNQLLWARPYYPADAYSWVVWGRFLIKIAGEDVSTPPPSHPASPSPMVNNIHHSLELAHVCVVLLVVVVCVCARVRVEGAWTNGGGTWLDQMLSYLMCIAHQKQQPVSPLGPCYPVRPDSPSASCLPGWCILGTGYFSVFVSFQLVYIWQEKGSVTKPASAVNVGAEI